MSYTMGSTALCLFIIFFIFLIGYLCGKPKFNLVKAELIPIPVKTEPTIFKPKVNLLKLTFTNYIEDFKLKIKEQEIKQCEIENNQLENWNRLFPFFVDFANQLNIPMFVKNSCDYHSKIPYFVIREYYSIELYFSTNAEPDYEFNFSEWHFYNHYNFSIITELELITIFKEITIKIMSLK